MYLSESLILPQHTSPFGFPHRGVGLARASAWEPPFTIECKTPEGALLPLTPGSGAVFKRTPGSGAAAVSQTHETDTRTSQTTSNDKTNPTHRGHAPVARPHTRTPERTRRHKPTTNHRTPLTRTSLKRGGERGGGDADGKCAYLYLNFKNSNKSAEE